MILPQLRGERGVHVDMQETTVTRMGMEALGSDRENQKKVLQTRVSDRPDVVSEGGGKG